MSEFEYPMWFKSKISQQIVRFDNLCCGEVIVKGIDNYDSVAEDVGFYFSRWIEHTDVNRWIDVTDQYKDKKEIPTIEMCGTPKCEHGVILGGAIGCAECEKNRKPLVIEIKEKTNKYKRKVPTLEIDVYDILKAFNVVNPATQHAIKKLLCAGDRGYKDKVQDLKEALASISRAIELESDNVEA